MISLHTYLLISFSNDRFQGMWSKNRPGAKINRTTTMASRTASSWTEVATGCGTTWAATWTTCTSSVSTVGLPIDTQCHPVPVNYHRVPLFSSGSSIVLRLAGCPAKHHCHGQKVHSGREDPILVPQGPLAARSDGTGVPPRWHLERLRADLQM